MSASHVLAQERACIDRARIALAFSGALPDDYRGLVDDLVSKLGAAAGWTQPGTALVALGGYGRGELAPRSDIDLLFLLRRHGRDEASVDSVLYPLWDLGFDVGHGLRTPAECGRLSREDLSAATAILDSRLLLGDRALLEDARRRAGIRPSGSRETRRWAQRILDDVDVRRARFGEVSHLLEPHVKEGRGGLRDFQAVRWLFSCLGHDANTAVLSLARGREAVKAFHFLSRVRAALHGVAGRKTDHLTFDFHREVATCVLADRPIEEFFEALHFAGHQIAGAWEEAADHARAALSRASHWTWMKPERPAGDLPTELERWCPSGEPLPGGLRRALSRLESNRAATLLTPLCARLLRRRTPLAPLLRSLHQLGLLGSVLPELEAVIHQVRYDTRHSMTTGTHCVECLAVLDDLWLGLLEREEPHLTRLASALQAPHVVRLAALCHDVGRAGDCPRHAEAGADIARQAALRLGFSESEAESVAALVRKHRALPSLAFRSDLESPVSWDAARRAAAPPASLEGLLALSFADLRATNPTRAGPWTDWSRDLLLTLYARAASGSESDRTLTTSRRHPLATEAPPREIAQVPSDLLAKLLAMASERGDGQSLWQVEPRSKDFVEVLGVAVASPHLLSAVTSALTGLRFDILSIQVHRWRDGTAHLWLRALRPEGAITPRDVIERLSAAAAGESPPPVRSRSGLLNPREDAMPVKECVNLEPGTDPYHSVLEVRCRDRRGLMRDLAAVFERLGLTVTYALATTIGPVAMDVFHLQDLFGGRIEGSEKIRVLLEEVSHAIRPGQTGRELRRDPPQLVTASGPVHTPTIEEVMP